MEGWITQALGSLLIQAISALLIVRVAVAVLEAKIKTHDAEILMLRERTHQHAQRITEHEGRLDGHDDDLKRHQQDIDRLEVSR